MQRVCLGEVLRALSLECSTLEDSPKRTSCDHFLADSSIVNLVTEFQIEIRTILPSILKCLNIEMEIEIDIHINININININKIL